MQTRTGSKVQGDVVLWEVNPGFTREVVTIVSGAGILKTGSVLGKITASGKYNLSTNTGSDGLETAAAILLEDIDASSADKTAVVLLRGPATVDETNLVFDVSVNDLTKRTAKKAQLKAIGIIAKKGA